MNTGDISIYIQDLRNFEDTVKNSMHISEALGDIITSNRIGVTHNLFNKFIMNCAAINRLCPYNGITPSPHTFWDFFSIATLTRSLFENYAAFYEMGINVNSIEEGDFKLELAIFHWDYEKYLFYKEANVDKETLEEFENGLPLQALELKNHPFFSQIPKHKQGKLLQGKVYLLKSYYEVLKSIDFKDAPIAAMYRFYSNYAHSTAFSVMTMSNERGRGLPNEVEIAYISFALTFANDFLIRITKEILDLLPEGRERADKTIIHYFEAEYPKAFTSR